jgi:hypothetical protein
MTVIFFVPVNEAELKRLKDAFKRTSTINGCMTKPLFVREVLGDGVPPNISEVDLNYTGVENSLDLWNKCSRENAFSSSQCQTSELPGAVHRARQVADISMISY